MTRWTMHLSSVLAVDPRQSTGATLWQWFLAFGAVLGVLAAAQQLWKWATNRKLERAERRALQILQEQLDAEGTRIEANRYEQLLLSLRSQVEREVPRQARAAFLANRIDSLATSISRDFDEYRAAKHELADLGITPASALDASIRDVVKQEISPRQSMQRRIQALTFASVALILFANLASFNLYDQTVRAFYYVYPWSWYSLLDPVFSVAWLTGLWVSLLSLSLYVAPARIRSRLKRSRVISVFQKRTAAVAASTCGAGVLLLLLGLIVGWASIGERSWSGTPIRITGDQAVTAGLTLILASIALAVFVVVATNALLVKKRAAE